MAFNSSPATERERPHTLYKYRDWHNPSHRRLLTHQEVFFASPKTLNDAFEAAYQQPDSDFARNEALEQRMRISFPDIDNPTIHSLAMLFSQWRASDGDHDKRDYTLTGDFLNLLLVNNATGVLSLSATALEPVMWSQYSCKHEGICIGLDTKKLLHHLNEPEGVTFELHPVIYASERHDLANRDMPAIVLLVHHLTVKSEGWAYESEHRVITLDAAERVVRLPEGVITEVILGYRMPDSHRDEVLAAVRNHPMVKTFQVERCRQSFNLGVVEIPR